MAEEAEEIADTMKLEDGDAAVFFRANGQFGMLLPKVVPGENIPPGALLAMCTREMVEDAKMTQTLIDRLVAKGLLNLNAPPK